MHPVRAARAIGSFVASEKVYLHESPEGEISIAGLEPARVRRFVLGELQGWTTATIRIVGGAISCYLRFRQMRGDDVQHLLGALLRVACWLLSSLPDVLSDAQIETLLASFGKDFPSRRRAYAMVRCLTDPGLRTSEWRNCSLATSILMSFPLPPSDAATYPVANQTLTPLETGIITAPAHRGCGPRLRCRCHSRPAGDGRRRLGPCLH